MGYKPITPVDLSKPTAQPKSRGTWCRWHGAPHREDGLICRQVEETDRHHRSDSAADRHYTGRF